jgi:N-acetylmuramoyl-L-alanine amidase
MKLRWGLLIASISVLLSFITVRAPVAEIKDPSSTAFTNRYLVKGSTGGDVYELQGRLKHLGFYRGPIDGIFGWRTYWAVRNFQYRYGIRADGIVGPLTKNKLYRATRNYRASASSKKGTINHHSPQGRITYNDMLLLARTVYGEARGEPFIGQVAVAATILNRLEDPRFPKTIPGIIFQPGAFTAVSDGQIWLTPNQTALKAVQDALNGWDPSGGSVYYFNPATATSGWIWSRPQIKRIGKHIFCR